ncbi:hypothetical protein E4T52_06787 [Aureobasidium sp. EXF-3400]|nr:hypothetical protein E4T51_06697 [Aureobasidium sp. EXF-12344]KAI4778318.1 hypothetical protein E4T52_06787 [Aureobasidium sp. EXF-3400]
MSLLTNSPITYETVREEMRRQLTPTEQSQYRGITNCSTAGKKYDQLYNISTAEDLITAELYGRRAIPSDFPSSMYLFSAGRGKTAKFNDEYFKMCMGKPETEEQKSARERYVPMSMEELETQYLGFEVPATDEKKVELEEHLTEVAEGFVIWWNEMVTTGDFACEREGCFVNKQGAELGG